MASRALSLCLATIRWAPVLFITAVIVWSYYAYVIQMCIFTVDSIPEKTIYLILYHPILFIFMWAYWKTIFTEPAGMPKEFYLSRSDTERFEQAENDDMQREILARHARDLPVQCRTVSGAIRFCEKCKAVKPDRAHHCSVCGKCILKMDHHCPWVNNCVCYSNYKFFVLFLGYALVYCLYVAFTSLQYFIAFWTNHGAQDVPGTIKFHVLFLFFVTLMFSISLLSLFAYHAYLTTQNRSTLESFRAPIFRSGPDKDGFSLGKYGNFIEIFGEEKKFWLLPIFTSNGDGVTYPTRVVPPVNNYQTMDNTNNPPPQAPQGPVSEQSEPIATITSQDSYGDGVTYPVRTIDEDYDNLLGQRQRWMEEGDDSPGYDNKVLNIAVED